MIKKRILCLLILVISLFTTVLVTVPYDIEASTTYYSSISDAATGSALKSSLRTLVTNTHTYITDYDDCKDPNIVKKTDGNESGTKIVLFWSELEVDTIWDGGTTWNREHVWPQSQGWFTESGAGADLHHIRPTDPSVNSSHNNNPYGYVNTNDYCHTSTKNGSITIDAKCKDGVFEPSDSKKGDTARIIFYLLVRYPQSDSTSITNVAQSMDMLLEWNRLDPVDASEQRRNDAVQDIQGNRNPFIDNSEYADLIWGGANPDDNPNQGGSSSTIPNVPTAGMVATFEFGSNDTSKNDSYNSGSALSNYTETNNGYTLTLSNLTKVFKEFDNSGNSCLKLGTSSVIGSFDFNVPSEIDQVIILIAGYKSNSASVNVNNNTHKIQTLSTNSEYTNIEVDTSSDKTVSISTTSSGYRCKINTIVLYDFSNDDSQTPSTDVEEALDKFESLKTKTSLMVDYNYNTYDFSSPKNYSYIFTSQIYTATSTQTLNDVNWNLEATLLNSNNNKYYGYDQTKGQQFGSANNPFKEVIFTTTDNTLDGVTNITIQTSGASGTDAKITAYVGEEIIGTTKSLTSSNATYTFTSSTGMNGNVKFKITQTTSKAIYIKGMSITYSETSSNKEDYQLNSAGIRFGSYITKDVFDQLNNFNTKWGVEYAVGNITDWTIADVKTIYCTPARVSSPNATTTSSTGEYYQWSLMIMNLNYSHIDEKVSARMFVEYEGVKYYMNTTTHSLRSLVDEYLLLDTSEFAEHIGILEHLKNYEG